MMNENGIMKETMDGIMDCIWEKDCMRDGIRDEDGDND